MNRIFTYLAAGLLVACNHRDVPVDQSFQPVLYASVTGGEIAENILVFNAGESDQPDLQSVRIRMRRSDGTEVELLRSGNRFSDPDEEIIQYESSYEFRLTSSRSGEAVCSLRVPPPLALVGMSEDTILLGSPGTVASIVNWTPLGSGYAYALQLECLEPDPQPIDDTPGFFEQRNGLSQLSPQLILLKDDFTYLGYHRLTVYAFSENLETMFFFDPADIRGLLRSPPDNVSGGKGYAVGISKFTVYLQINQ